MAYNYNALQESFKNKDFGDFMFQRQAERSSPIWIHTDTTLAIVNAPHVQHVIRLAVVNPYSTTTSQIKMASILPSSEQYTSAYSFPHHRLRTQSDASKIPIVLVACGSYSPITNLHLQMFEMATDHIKFNTNFEFMGGYFSPVSDAYKKQGLANSNHRIRMCELAVSEKRDGKLMVDSWEASQPNYTSTAAVLDHFDHEINSVLGGVERTDSTRVPTRIMLLAGADLIETFSTPGVWGDEDISHILGDYGAFVVTRSGTDVEGALESLQRWKKNIYVIVPHTINDVSSTKLRLAVKKRMSIEYLTPDPVVEYIKKNGLYQPEEVSSPGKEER